MSRETVISVEGLSKKYILGQNKAGSGGLRHAVEDLVKAPVRWVRGEGKKAPQGPNEFWAVKDVSLFLEKRLSIFGVKLDKASDRGEMANERERDWP